MRNGKTSCYPPIIKKVFEAAGGDFVTHHEPTESNGLGQTSLARMIEDILDVIEECEPGRETRALYTYFSKGEYVFKG